MNNNIGINITEIKKISKLFLDTEKNIKTIFSEYKRVIDKSDNYFIGEVGDAYRKKFNIFYEKLNILTNSFGEYSKHLNAVLDKYNLNQTTAFKIVTDIK